MQPFLNFYNYHKILPIIQNEKKDLEKGHLCQYIYKIIRKKDIREAIFHHEELEDNFNKILRSEKMFFPEQKIINYENKKNEKINIKYYDDFIIFDEKLYNEIKDDKGNTHTFLHDPKELNILLINKIFIYQIKDNIIGFGVPRKLDNLQFYLFKVLIILVGDNKINNKKEILKSNEIHNLINHKITNNDLNVEIIEFENQKNEKKISIYEQINFTFGEGSKQKIFYNSNSYKKEGYNNSNQRYENIKVQEQKDKISEIPNFINDTNIEEIQNLYIIENVVGDGNCLFYALSQLIFGNVSYGNIIREKVCDYNQNHNENFIINKEEYLKNMRRNKEYGGYIEIGGFSFLCDIKLKYYVREINDRNSNENGNIKCYTFNEEKEGNFAILMDYYRNAKVLNHFYSCKCKNGIGISDEKLKKIKEIFIKEENNLSLENHEYINDDINNDEKEMLNQKDKFGWKFNDNSPDFFNNTNYTIIPKKENLDYDCDEDSKDLCNLKDLKVDNEIDFNFKEKENPSENIGIKNDNDDNDNNNNKNDKNDKINNNYKYNNDNLNEFVIKMNDDEEESLFITQPPKTSNLKNIELKNVVKNFDNNGPDISNRKTILNKRNNKIKMI